jgi:hypothetical protein
MLIKSRKKKKKTSVVKKWDVYFEWLGSRELSAFRIRISLLTSADFLDFLIATVLFVLLSTALNTVEKAPAPRILVLNLSI